MAPSATATRNAAEEHLRKVVWDGMLTAMFSMRYYEALYRRYSFRDSALKVLVGVTSPSTLAGVGVLSSYPNASQLITLVTVGFGIAAAVGSVLVATLGYSTLLSKFGSLYNHWAKIVPKYDDLWNQLEMGTNVTLAQFQNVNLQSYELSGEELEVPRDPKLLKKCQEAVKKVMYPTGT